MARESGYEAGRWIAICMNCSSMGMLAVISRAEGETRMVSGWSEESWEEAHSLTALSSETMIEAEI